MIDLSVLTFGELLSLHWDLSWVIFTRMWWVWGAFLVGALATSGIALWRKRRK